MKVLLLFTGLLVLVNFTTLEALSADKCDLKAMRWVGIPFNKEGRFQKHCRPQVLYSWIASLDTINQKDLYWPFRRKRAIFFHRTPLATSIYGSYSYRVKLKPNVRFKLVPWNEAHYKCLYPEWEKKKTVYVNQDRNGFSEYVLCSDGPVESWSFGMPEHLNEMKREFNLIKELGALNVDGFLNPNTRKYGCEKCFQRYTIHDARNDGSETTILNSIDYMDRTVDLRVGAVYDLVARKKYQQGEAVKKHFETMLKLPFHKR